MTFNEDSRVKIPALVHFTRFGYTYLHQVDKVNYQYGGKGYYYHFTAEYSLLHNQLLTRLRDFLLPVLTVWQVRVGERAYPNSQ